MNSKFNRVQMSCFMSADNKKYADSGGKGISPAISLVSTSSFRTPLGWEISLSMAEWLKIFSFYILTTFCKVQLVNTNCNYWRCSILNAKILTLFHNYLFSAATKPFRTSALLVPSYLMTLGCSKSWLYSLVGMMTKPFLRYSSQPSA